MSNHIPYTVEQSSDEEKIKLSEAFFQKMNTRRSVRFFSDKPVPFEVIENCIKTASTAPSGAHKQPWTFCVIESAEIKKKIKEAAEQEEYESYNGRMSESWLKDLEVFETNWEKPFLEIAPYLIIVFKRAYEFGEESEKKNNYYVNESVGLATGMLLAAIHNAGLASLTHTPSPMNFLQKILDRPANERAFLLIPVGYPSEDCKVPVLKRKELDEILVKY